jgi:hypothetical protein
VTQSNDRRFDGVAVVGGITLALIASAIWLLIERRELPTVQLDSPNGTLVVEIADTPATRSTGLSNRDTLKVDGLLLQWDTPGRHPIWMADMRFPLDLVWLDSDGRVLLVLANVPPCRAEPCPLYEPDQTDRSAAVLEMPAGTAARHGVAAGAVIRYSADPRSTR